MSAPTSPTSAALTSKVPVVTLAFWVIKICATTLGETGGDAVSMTLKLGYAVGTAIFFGIFLVAVTAQIRARTYHPWLYWTVIVATTTVGTTVSDFLTRTAGLGYFWSSVILFAAVLAVLAAWYFALGTVSVSHLVAPRAEGFYWTTILVSNTLGTALGDCLADTTPLGYEGGALVFGGLLAVLAVLYRWTGISRTGLFWAAFILTRPLGATLGDLLTKPVDHGGLHLGRIVSSLALAAVIVALVAFTARRRAALPDAANAV